MKFQTGRGQARDYRNEEEEDDVLNFDDNPKPGRVVSRRIFLDRWGRRAAYRRARMARELLTTPLSPERIQRLTMWLRNLEARKAWLIARLEDNLGLESILRAAIERQGPLR